MPQPQSARIILLSVRPWQAESVTTYNCHLRGPQDKTTAEAMAAAQDKPRPKAALQMARALSSAARRFNIIVPIPASRCRRYLTREHTGHNPETDPAAYLAVKSCTRD